MAALSRSRDDSRARRVAAALATLLLVAGVSADAGQTRANTGTGGAAANTSGEPVDLQDADLGPTAPDTAVEFTVVLRQPHPVEAAAFLTALGDPTSPGFRQFLTPEAFGQRFGPPAERIEQVRDWLAGRGFAVEPAPPQRTSLTVRGTVAAINAAFDITMVDRRDPAGRAFRAPDAPPTVPAAIRGDVAAIASLDTRPREPASVPILAAVPGGAIDAEVAARAYEIEALHQQGLTGEGQSIGIVSFDTYDQADIDAFDRITNTRGRGGGTPPPVEQRRLAGARTTPGSGKGEVTLDIDVIRTIAPLARIINYEAPNGGFAPVIREIVRRREVDIVSISWGICERKLSRADRVADDAEFAAAAAVGISIFVASGDHGAHDCRFWPQPDDEPTYRDLGLSVTAPANESVILVGGTYLTTTSTGTYVAEAAWADALSGWGSGGGVSSVYPRPAWQLGAGVDNEFSTGNRQVPDVAGPADTDSPWLIVETQADDAGPTRHASGGTSAAAPFWAGSMLLVRQLAERDGRHAAGFGQLGALGPLLYQLAAAAPAGSLFHDVIRGGNLYYDATAGWDYATGLGSPRVAPLARAIVDSLP